MTWQQTIIQDTRKRIAEKEQEMSTCIDTMADAAERGQFCVVHGCLQRLYRIEGDIMCLRKRGSFIADNTGAIQ